MPPRIAERERAAVRQSFARLDAAKAVWDGRKGELRQYQECLRNVFPKVMPGNDENDSGGEQVNVNHPSRVVAFCKSKFDISPEIRISSESDADMKTNGMNEHILSRVADKGGLPRAGRKSIDDMMTLGAWIVGMGVDTFAIDPARLQGLSTDPADLVALAAQGQDVHPLPGMDHAQTSQLAQDMFVQSTWTRTEAQKQNLLRLAMEAEVALQQEKDAPVPFMPYNIWYQSLQIGYHLFIDSTAFRLEDARRMWRRIVFTVEQFKAWEPFKSAARRQARPTSRSGVADEKRPPVNSSSASDQGYADKDSIDLCYVVWEEWNKDDQAVHYLCEGWEGYLEIDSTYPFLDENGRPGLEHFFPFWWAVPYEHNIPDATQPLGVPAFAFMFPQVMEVIKYRSASMNTSKQAADQYLVSSRLDDDIKENFRRGVPGAMHEVPEDMLGRENKAIERIETGMDPVIFDKASDRAERDLYAMASVNAGNITGEPAANTVGQEEMLMRGGGSIQGDVMALVADAYSGLMRDTATVIRLLFTPQHVAQYVGMRYITPQVDGTGNVVAPAPFAEWKAASLDGVTITASFATKGDTDDPVAIKMLTDVWIGTMNWKDSLGMPVRDPAPIFDLLTKRMGIGRVPAYQASINELRAAVLKQMMEQNGGVGPGGPEGSDDGDGDESGRKKDDGSGERGKPAIPGRQERSRKPGDAGDRSNTVHRVHP